MREPPQASANICIEGFELVCPCMAGDPYHPVPIEENLCIVKKYNKLAASLSKVYFSGKLATYQYL